VGHLQLTLFMFSIFSYCAIWFMFYNEGPAAWFENHYFVKNAGTRHESASANQDAKREAHVDFVE